MNPLASRLAFGSVTRYVVNFDADYAKRLAHHEKIAVRNKIAEQLKSAHAYTAVQRQETVPANTHIPYLMVDYAANPNTLMIESRPNVLTIGDDIPLRRRTPGPEYAFVVVKDNDLEKEDPIRLNRYIGTQKRECDRPDSYTRYQKEQSAISLRHFKALAAPPPGKHFLKNTVGELLRHLLPTRPASPFNALDALDRRYCDIAETTIHLSPFQNVKTGDWEYNETDTLRAIAGPALEPAYA